MSSFPIAPLPSGPVDVVGDVHGEREALDALVRQLGYDENGVHPEGRRLVFVGDLVDRGHDSPGVVERVKRFMGEGGALCVLGNHELNLLSGFHKAGNGWFYGEEETFGMEAYAFGSRTLRTEAERKDMLRFFEGLPLAPEREDLRVVHAEWCETALETLARLSGADEIPPFEEREASELRAEKRADEGWRAEKERFPDLRDEVPAPPLLPRHAFWTEREQNMLPHKIVTSGRERARRPDDPPRYLGGRWRMARRVDWWDEVPQDVPGINGHYWRPWSGPKTQERALFRAGPLEWMGVSRRVFCVDYCAGMRFRERAGLREPGHTRLVALRWDDGPPRVITDVGEDRSLPAPGA